VAAIVAAVLALSGVFDSTEGSDAASTERTTAKVARRDLVQRSTVSGTLGYNNTRAIVNDRSGTITSLPEEGRVLRPGAVIYRIDERPVVLLSGGKPAWRPLVEGVSDGRDVRQLEQNLRALGYDDERELTVDEHFDAATATAVERWQEDLGVTATGRVAPWEIVFLPGAARRVGTVSASLGDRVRPGARLMDTSSTKRLITAEIEAGDQEDIAVGDKVTIDLRNGTTTTGTISKVGKVASAPKPRDGQMAGASTPSTISFEVRLNKPAVAGALDQAPVDVGITSERAKNALSVPVSALIALRGGRYGVEVMGAGTATVVEVTPGLYSDGGYVELTRGQVRAGELVVVPA
jgi:peptidoglycan hydrolase-like protein with peptidoglycan-binding domain